MFEDVSRVCARHVPWVQWAAAILIRRIDGMPVNAIGDKLSRRVRRHLMSADNKEHEYSYPLMWLSWSFQGLKFALTANRNTNPSVGAQERRVFLKILIRAQTIDS